MRYLPFIAGKPDGSREGRHSSAAIGEPGAVCFVFSVVRDIASIAMSWALEPIGRKPMASGPPVHGRELSVEETAATFRGASSVPPQTCYGGKRKANGIKCRVSANLLLLQASRWEGRVFRDQQPQRSTTMPAISTSAPKLAILRQVSSRSRKAPELIYSGACSGRERTAGG